MLMSVPIVIALLKLTAESNVYQGKKVSQSSSGEIIMKTYEHVCREIN